MIFILLSNTKRNSEVCSKCSNNEGNSDKDLSSPLQVFNLYDRMCEERAKILLILTESSVCSSHKTFVPSNDVQWAIFMVLFGNFGSFTVTCAVPKLFNGWNLESWVADAHYKVNIYNKMNDSKWDVLILLFYTTKELKKEIFTIHWHSCHYNLELTEWGDFWRL